jgi:hypothetical protein
MRSKLDAAASLEQTCAAVPAAAATRLPGKGKDAVTAGKWEGSVAANNLGSVASSTDGRDKMERG